MLKFLGSWRHRHYGEHAVLIILLASAGVDWVPMSETGRTITDVVGSLVLVAAWVIVLGHARGVLCETCISSMPLDTDTAVRRRKWALRIFHAATGSLRRYFAFLGVLVAISLAQWGVSKLTGRYSAPRIAVGNLFTAVLIVYLLAHEIHRRLYPWCPWCRGGGGDDDRTEAPTPTEPEKV